MKLRITGRMAGGGSEIGAGAGLGAGVGEISSVVVGAGAVVPAVLAPSGRVVLDSGFGFGVTVGSGTAVVPDLDSCSSLGSGFGAASGLTSARTEGGIASSGPLIADEDDEHPARTYCGFDRLDKVCSGLNAFDVHEHALGAKVTGQPVVQTPSVAC